MSEREDKLLAEQMAKLGRENEEVSGDEDSEEEEDTGMGDVDLENSGTGITDWKLQSRRRHFKIFLLLYFFFNQIAS